MSLSLRALLFDWFKPSERHVTRKHILRGFTKAFLVYFVPITLFRREFKVQHFRRALALGIFVAGVRAVDAILSQVKQQKEGKDTEAEIFVKKYSLGIAAFVSALAGVIIDGEAHHSVTLVIWSLVRAMRPFIPEINHGPTMLMCVCAGQILSTWISSPGDHNSAYLKFLNHHGGKSPAQMKALQGKIKDTCAIIHPGTGCESHFLRFLFLESIPRSLKVYVPVFAVAFLFSKKKSVYYTLVAIIRSTLFLSLYCAIAWYSSCKYPQMFSKPEYVGRFRLFLHTWTAGLATLVESKSRRAELAAYCLTYALETIFHYLEKRGILTVYPALNQFILAITAGILLHHPEQQPKVLMTWLFKLGSIDL